MSKEQLAGLVEEMSGELEMAGYRAVIQLPTESLRDWHERLAATLATLPEPGVVSAAPSGVVPETAVEAALNGFFQEGPVQPRTEYAKESMRCALSDALPYLAAAAKGVG